MEKDQLILFGLFAGVFVFLLWGRWRYDFVAFFALMLGVVLGVVPAESAFAGFGHPATIIVALVLVVSSGLVRSGAVLLITRTLVDSSRSLGAHVAMMGGVGGVLSAFMNNVAALALLMPVDIQTARKAGRSAGLSLMPLSFATILGGMTTLIGTPPNIIIGSMRERYLGQSFSMFDFTPVGGVVAVAGILFVALVGWRLIPVRGENVPSAGDVNQYVAELTVPMGSNVIGGRLGALSEHADKADVAILGLIRDGERLYGRARGNLLQAGDVLILEGVPEALDEFRTALGLAFSDQTHEDLLKAEGEGLDVIEVVVPRESWVAGRTAQQIGLSWRQRALLMGVSRQGRRITREVRKRVIQPGDILLLLVQSDTGPDVVDWLGALPLASRGLQVTRNTKTWSSIGFFSAAVVAASLGLIELEIALGLVVICYLLFRIVPIRGLYDQIEWPVIVLLGSMIPLGLALEESGGTEAIARGLLGLTGSWPAWAIMAALMVVTMTLSDVLNNTATTIVAAPIAIQMARSLDVSPDAFLMAVAIAASSAFLTPIGHKNNTLILGPGGYRFGDYWRMGLPLELLVIAVSIPMILLVWPL